MIARAFALSIALASAAFPPPTTTPAGRAFARSMTHMTAADVTANLAGNAGKRVGFVCEINAIVDARSMIGQCGKAIEPVDLYVHLPTATLHLGEKLRVFGTMEPPAQWVDVNGHTWYTPFVHAEFVDRLSRAPAPPH